MRSLSDFYTQYEKLHQNYWNRLLHLIGTLSGIFTFVYSLVTQTYWLLLMVPVVSYFFAWAGHFIFERNTPATFYHPLLSVVGDLRMVFTIIKNRRIAK